MDTKICSKCNQSKDIEEFSFHSPSKNDGKRRPDCKQCVRDRTALYCQTFPDKQKARMKLVRIRAKLAAKQFVTTYLETHPCVDCGESDIIVLDFDHVRGKKVCDVSYMVASGYRLWRIKAEIQKCEVRCANDHRRRHAGVVQRQNVWLPTTG